MRRAAWALLLFCGCSDEGTLTPGEGRLVIEPLEIDFGRRFIGEVQDQSIRIEVLGSAPVEYRARFGLGQGEGLSAAPSAGRVSPSQPIELTLRFAPTEEGPRSTFIFIDDETGTATVSIVADARFVPDCEDGNICTSNRFDFELGRCVTETGVEDCDDFDACTLEDRCASGLCLGMGRSCDDGNTCTDDFCDARTGCVNVLAAACDDGDPCTEDLCDPRNGCRHEPLPDFTPCGSCRACRSGRCELGDIAEGRACDDGDVCTTEEACTAGECLEDGFPYPASGELQFATSIGPLAPGAGDNPVVDVDGTTFVGVIDGVVAVGPCGEIAWERRGLDAPQAGSMLISPTGLSVPFGNRILDLDRADQGATLSDFVLDEIEGVDTASASVSIQDMSIQSSGALVLSLWLDRPGVDRDEGLIATLDAERRGAQLLAPLGRRFARRLVVDLDETPVLLLREGPPGAAGEVEEQVVRLGPQDLPLTRWSGATIVLPPGELSLDGASRVLWSGPLLATTREGFPTLLGAEASAPRGVIISDRDRVSFVDTGPEGSALVGLQSPDGQELYRRALPGPAAGNSPASDAAGNVYVASADGWLTAIDRNGEDLYEIDLGFEDNAPISVTINPERLIIVVASETVFGVETELGLNSSAWPRRRRDNFGTARR
ncbi:MAG: hypothetical protein AAF627_07600 [Myxococcota bacterium]